MRNHIRRRVTSGAVALAAFAGVSAAAAGPANAAYVSIYYTYTTVARTPMYESPGVHRFYFIEGKGSNVGITCWRRGPYTQGSTVWYRLTPGPGYPDRVSTPGYSPAYDVKTTRDPDPNIRPC